MMISSTIIVNTKLASSQDHQKLSPTSYVSVIVSCRQSNSINFLLLTKKFHFTNYKSSSYLYFQCQYILLICLRINEIYVHKEIYLIKAIRQNKYFTFQSDLQLTEGQYQNLEPFQFNIQFVLKVNILIIALFKLILSVTTPKTIPMSLITHNQFQENFTKLQQLGEGNCAEVFKIQHKSTKETFALKLCSNPKFSEYGQVANEIEIITKLDDEAIPKIYHYYFQDDFNEQETHKRIKIQAGIIMELCDKTLDKEIKDIFEHRILPYTPYQMWGFIKEMVRFFAKMQKMGYNHRDIKSANIMIQGQGKKKKYKVIDFGYSLKDTSYASETITGTYEYSSPKVKRKFDDKQVHIPGGLNVKDDVFSLGKTILQLLRGKNIENCKIVPSYFEKKIRQYDANLSFLLEKMLKFEETERWDFIRVEEEIIKIQVLKASNNISLDDSMQVGNHEVEQVQWAFSQEESQAYRFVPDSFKKIKDSRTRAIETQTVSIQIQPKEWNFGHKIFNKIHNSAETRYIENCQPRTQGDLIISKVYLSRCSFQAEIHSIKVFDDFALFGMRNHIGVIPLKQKREAIYMFRPQQFDGTTKQAFFSKILVVGTNIVFVGNFEYFLYCPLDLLVKQMNSMFENHEQMEKDRNIRQIYRKSYGKKTEYREPTLYEGKINFLVNDKSHAKISCMSFPDKPFLGFRNPAIFGHCDGSVSIFNQLIIHKKDDAITDMIAFDSNKLLFATKEGWMKMIIFPSDINDEFAEHKVYQFNTESKILLFKLLSPVKNQIEPSEDQALAEVYLSNGQKISLNHELQKLGSTNVKRKVHIDKVVESKWKWSIKKPVQNLLQEDVVAERKISQSQLTLEMETYLITDIGQVFRKGDCKVVADFDMADPMAFDASKNLMVIADAQGNVKLLYPEQIFDNVHKPRVEVERKEVSRIVQRVSQYFLKQKPKGSSSSDESETQESNSHQQRPAMTYSQYLSSVGKSIDFGMQRGNKLRTFQSQATQ